MNIAIITAKKSNSTLPSKNILPINGKPCVVYSINAAINSKLIDRVYITTDCEIIAKIGKENGCFVIERPENLCLPETNHGDVIYHAFDEIEKLNHGEIHIITVLIGNTVMTTSDDIDNTIFELLKTENVDSCMTVWKAQDDHPMRAMKINPLTGYLESYFSSTDIIDTNRQSYPDVFYYDQGPWTFRSRLLRNKDKVKSGPGPWWWMGNKCIPLERPWVTGRDTHNQLDVEIATWWLDRFGNAHTI